MHGQSNTHPYVRVKCYCLFILAYFYFYVEMIAEGGEKVLRTAFMEILLLGCGALLQRRRGFIPRGRSVVSSFLTMYRLCKVTVH